MNLHRTNHLESGKFPPKAAVAGTERLELKALYEIARLVGLAINLDSTLAAILRILHDTLRMERATVVLLDENRKQLSIRSSYGLTSEEESRGVYGLDEGVCGKIFQSMSPFVVPDVHSEPLFLNRTGSRTRIDKGRISFIGVPVVRANRPVGVLTVDRLFGDAVSFKEDVRFLTVVAILIGQFLELHQNILRQEASLREENISLKAELNYRFSHHNIIGQSKVIQDLFRVIDKVAPSAATVLLLGESGTGKELVARALHQASPRSGGPFLKVNCAALPENLLESELLGHEKGAFTGAMNTKKGRFELAHGGTLFLDEVGELPLALQAKLLRVLQERQFERLGGTRTITVDVRLIAATNRNLEKEVLEGGFRTDLYYRLNVVPVMLPPLRERREDIGVLIDHFLRESNLRNNRRIRFSKEVLDFLLNYKWPGNVRELQNLVERLVIMADTELLRLADLPTYMTAVKEDETSAVPHANTRPSPGMEAKPLTHNQLMELERAQIETALKRYGWVRARAARELGLSQRQIGYKMVKYGISPPDGF
ncbi:MAG: nif-specific transcriptional activator NifA [Syntrophales bacterium]